MYKTFEQWAMMSPMKYSDKHPEDLSPALLQKYNAMIYNENDQFVATEKFDGEWTMFIRWNDQFLIRSRSISKVTGKYGDKTAHLPHLVEEMKQWPRYAVVLGEVCWNEYGTVSTDVGTILRCLPEKAVARQKDKKLVTRVFDVLLWSDAEDANDYINTPYCERLSLINNIFSKGFKYFLSPNICPADKTPAEFADEIISAGGEGAVIQRKDYVYEPGKRTAWKTQKLKQRLPEMELKVIKTLKPNKNYEGDCISSWKYFDQDGNPVTKPYAMGWKNGVVVALEDGNVCEVTSGLSDADREWLATAEAKEMIAAGELYAVIRAMNYSKKGLRHPVLVRLRNDM